MRQGIRRSVGFAVAGVLALASLALVAEAKMPPNPDRLDRMTDCDSAQRERAAAVQGSPLRSAAKNQEYLAQVEEFVARMCGDARPPPTPRQ